MNPFVKSPEILTVIGLAKEFQKTPAEIINLQNTYDAYCFNCACLFIINKMKDGEKPNFRKFKTENMHYSKPSDLYKDLMN